MDDYLKKVALFTGQAYGKQMRSQFRDIKGTSELAMLQSPSEDELAQLKKAVAIMTPAEKQNAAELNDNQIQKIAADANIDPGVFAIFINGYNLECKRVS